MASPGVAEASSPVSENLDRSQSHAQRSARLLDFGGDDGIGAVVRRILAAGAMVAGEAHAADRTGARQGVRGAVPVDDARPRIGPEAVILLGTATNQRGGKAEAGLVRFRDGLLECPYGRFGSSGPGVIGIGRPPLLISQRKLSVRPSAASMSMTGPI